MHLDPNSSGCVTGSGRGHKNFAGRFVPRWCRKPPSSFSGYATGEYTLRKFFNTDFLRCILVQSWELIPFFSWPVGFEEIFMFLLKFLCSCFKSRGAADPLPPILLPLWFFLFCERFENAADTLGTLPQCWTLPPIIKFLKLRACLVKIKGPTPSNRERAAIATRSNGTVRYRTSVGLKLTVTLEQ